MSDGYHSVHMMVASDMETMTNERDKSECDEKLIQISGFHTPISLSFLVGYSHRLLVNSLKLKVQVVHFRSNFHVLSIGN